MQQLTPFRLISATLVVVFSALLFSQTPVLGNHHKMLKRPAPVSVAPVGTAVPLPPPSGNVAEQRAQPPDFTGPAKVDVKAPTDDDEVGAVGVAAADATRDEDDYLLTVSYAFEAGADEGAPAIPSGHKRLVATASVLNNSDEAVQITPESLVLIDKSGTTYTPLSDAGISTSSLVNAVVEPGQSRYDVASFDLPVEAQPDRLVWCPGTSHPCYPAYEATIP